jgi:hypothetical protein
VDEVESCSSLDVAFSREIVAGLCGDIVELNWECRLESWGRYAVLESVIGKCGDSHGGAAIAVL